MIRQVARKIRRLFHSSTPGDVQPRVIRLPPVRGIYFAIPKVANSSLKEACFQILLQHGLPRAQLPDLDWTPKLFNLPQYARVLKDEGIIIERAALQEYRDHWKFAFVRNPWDRLVSCYENKIKQAGYDDRWFVDGVARSLVGYGRFEGGMSFDDFVQVVASIPDSRADKHFRSQHTFIQGRDGELLVDFVGRFERLEEDFDHVCNSLGVTGVKLPHLLQSDRLPYTDYYSRSSEELVRDRYRTDVEWFDYECE